MLSIVCDSRHTFREAISPEGVPGTMLESNLGSRISFLPLWLRYVALPSSSDNHILRHRCFQGKIWRHQFNKLGSCTVNLDEEPGLSDHHCLVHFQWHSLHIYRNTLIRRTTSLSIIGDLFGSGFKKNYVQLLLIIPWPATKPLSISLHPQHWWISHNFVTYTISYHTFWQ